MAILHVRTTGDDGTGDGTFQKPFLTIGKGITESATGDTVDVGEGQFSESAGLTVLHSLTIRGKGAGATTWLTPTGTSQLVQDDGAASALVLERMFFSYGGDPASVASWLLDNQATTGGSSCTARECILRSQESDALIALLFDTDTEPGMVLRLENCVLDGFLNQGLNHGIQTASPDTDLKLFNTVLTNLQDAVREYTDSVTTLTGEIIPLNFKSENNCYWENQRVLTNDALSHGSGDIFVDPQFVDSPGNNYALRVTSPCLNAGQVI